MITSANNLPLFPKGSISAEFDPLYYESIARQEGYEIIAGVDEAGRGPLAGPVVASAVVLPKGVILEGVTDSKKMTEKAREEAFPFIIEKSLALGVGVVSHRYIDQHNILNASLEAMKRAVQSLDFKPGYLLVDGINAIPMQVMQRCIKKGDLKSASISAASVIAKVYRDRIMHRFHEEYPEYGLDKNKGYGTAKHRKAIEKHGPCPIHRKSFRGVREFDSR